jgi:glycosyltransferase involved in cell wall biosynthesis
VLIDDGQDDTLAIARRYLEPHRERFRRIVLERQENQGVSAASNAVIAACQGEWVHLLGSDDVLYPDKVARIQQAIADWDCPDLAMVHADADTIDQHGRPVVRRRQKPRPAPGPDREAWRVLFLGDNFIVNPTVALRRDAFLAVSGFDRNLALEDIDCWLRLSAAMPSARGSAGERKHPGTLCRRVRMLGAFHTFGKFLAGHEDLIADADIRRHFRRYLKRFWRRMRRKQPWLLPLVLGAQLISHLRTPQAEDYRRFGGCSTGRQPKPRLFLYHSLCPAARRIRFSIVIPSITRRRTSSPWCADPGGPGQAGDHEDFRRRCEH